MHCVEFMVGLMIFLLKSPVISCNFQLINWHVLQLQLTSFILAYQLYVNEDVFQTKATTLLATLLCFVSDAPRIKGTKFCFVAKVRSCFLRNKLNMKVERTFQTLCRGACQLVKILSKEH